MEWGAGYFLPGGTILLAFFLEGLFIPWKLLLESWKTWFAEILSLLHSRVPYFGKGACHVV